MINLISTTNDKETKAFDPSSVAELKQLSEQELRDKIYAEVFNDAMNTLKSFNGDFVITEMENAEHPIFKERQRRNLRYNQFYSAIPPSSYADRVAAKEDARLNPAKYISSTTIKRKNASWMWFEETSTPRMNSILSSATSSSQQRQGLIL